MASSAFSEGSLCARSWKAWSVLVALSRIVCAKASHCGACWLVIFICACRSSIRFSTKAACFCAWLRGAEAAEEGAAVESLAAAVCAHAEVVKQASVSSAGATAIRMNGFMLGGLNELLDSRRFYQDAWWSCCRPKYST